MTNSATSASAPPRSGSPGRRRVRWLSVLVGGGLAVGGSVFVVERIVSGWAEYGDIISRARWGWLVAALPAAMLGMSAMGLVWRHIIAALGGHATRRQVFVWYQIGNLGKYLPGGVWPLLGRSELAVRGGLPRPLAYNSVALSMGATYLCAAIVSALLLPVVLLEQGAVGAQVWVLALVPVGLAALHPSVLGYVFRLSERVFGKGSPLSIPRWSTSIGLVARHSGPWLVNGVATWLVALTFTPDAPFAVIVFAGIISWVIGFVVFFVPGGIGVREAAFTVIVSLALPAALAGTIAVVSRLVFAAADALGAVAATGLAGWPGGTINRPAVAPERE